MLRIFPTTCLSGRLSHFFSELKGTSESCKSDRVLRTPVPLFKLMMIRVRSLARDLTRIIISLNKGTGVRNTLSDLQLSDVPLSSLKKWDNLPDRQVVGKILSTACYLPESFTASLYLAR